MTDLGDKLAALGFGKSGKGAGKRNKARSNATNGKKVADFRTAPPPRSDVSDLEAAMMQKHAESSSYGSAAERPVSKPSSIRTGPMDTVTIEVRQRPPARPVATGTVPTNGTGRQKQLGGQLTAAAQKRLRYAPPRPIEEDAARTVASEEPPLNAGGGQEHQTPLDPAIKHQVPEEPRELSYSEAFKRITTLVGASTPGIEPRPKSMTSEGKDRLDRRVALGAAWLRANPDPDELDGYVVGFDFGTSSLKLVVREPYGAGNEVAAVPAPTELRSRKHPYLWQTVVWFNPVASTFHLYPVPGAKVLEGFKTGIVGGNGKEAVWEDPHVSRSEAATAFIALHLCHLIGWYQDEKPLTRSVARNYLSINIGVPVATQDNPEALAPFKEVIRAAVELARTCEPVTLKNVKDALEISRDETIPHGFSLIPELSAALVGYAINPTNPNGAHVLIDVGASTLDIVAFNLVENRGQPEIKAFAASVELLGAAALDVVRAAGIDEAEFSKACNQQFGATYGDAITAAPSSFSKKYNSNRPDVRLVITGGGCRTSVHSGMIDDLPKRQLGEQTPSRPEPPKEIATIDCDRARLLLAYGLAHDHPDIPHPTLPSQIPQITVQPRNDGPVAPGPEQV